MAVIAAAEQEGLMVIGAAGEYIQLTIEGVAWCEQRGLRGMGVGYSSESSDGLNAFLLLYGKEIGLPLEEDA